MMEVENNDFRSFLPPIFTGLSQFERALFMALGLLLYGGAITE